MQRPLHRGAGEGRHRGIAALARNRAHRHGPYGAHGPRSPSGLAVSWRSAASLARSARGQASRIAACPAADRPRAARGAPRPRPSRPMGWPSSGSGRGLAGANAPPRRAASLASVDLRLRDRRAAGVRRVRGKANGHRGGNIRIRTVRRSCPRRPRVCRVPDRAHKRWAAVDRGGRSAAPPGR